MTDSLSGVNDDTVRSVPRQHADLRSLERLIGTWTVTGEAAGTVTYEWAGGGFFLLQHVELGGSRGLEVIGHDHGYGEEPSADIRSHYYGFGEGETLDYTYEITDDTLTIWMGERGSPAYYEGTFDAAGTVLTGAWHYPGGGGYSTISTKVTAEVADQGVNGRGPVGEPGSTDSEGRMNEIAPWLLVRDAAAAVEFYRRAFGATTGELAEGGGELHVGELFVEGARFWVQHDPELPAGLDPGRPVRMILTVADPDAAFQCALSAGAVEIAGVHDEGGWRTGRLVDPFGHQWELARPIRLN